MSEPPLITRQRALLRKLLDLGQARAATERKLEQDLRSGTGAVEADHEQRREALDQRVAADIAQADQALTQAQEEIQARFDAEKQAIDAEFHVFVEMATTQYRTERDARRTSAQESRWMAAADLDGGKSLAREQLRNLQGKVAGFRDQATAIRKQAKCLLEKWQQSTDSLDKPPPQQPPIHSEPEACLKDARVDLAKLQRLILPRLLRGGRFALLCVAFWLLVSFPAGLLAAHLANFNALIGLAIGGVAALAVAAIGHPALMALAGSRIDRLVRPLVQALAEAEHHCRRIVDEEMANSDRLAKEASDSYFHTLSKLQQTYEDTKQSLRQQRLQAHREAQERGRQRTREARLSRDTDLAKAKEWHIRERTNIELHAQAERHRVDADHKVALETLRQRYEAGWFRLQEQWHSELAKLRETVQAINADEQRLFPAWNDIVSPDWRAPTALPEVLLFGKYDVQRRALPDGVPTDPRPANAWLDDFSLPAFRPFPDGYAMLFESAAEGRGPAVAAVQAILYRLLTVVPPGKLRFTIVDPVDLGENFAGLMHLSDYDPLLVTSRIWTEPAHIEQRLTDLTAHMENVIQKYLRNKYPTIAAYNAEAGEVAEPLRVLVVADFPVNFTDAAARRLVSICENGARCGVSTLITVDTRQPLPRGFDLGDLERAGATLVWKDGRFRWQDEDFGRYPLRLAEPPDDAIAGQLLDRIGALARDARRVEVPFEFVAPVADGYWAGDSRTGIMVALGRSGATRRQVLQFGKGTSQHGLVAGKTGSGKSTLLHALIVNLALHYSPREIELYLIDFKKGVEFKTYAVHELPHARVVAIESEREFGLSVLQRLDAELTWRGERFRDAGVQDLNSYRQARPDALAPRILLVVDEFQEFFTEDDRISQEAAQLLDRLVRQGRAFGLHVLLGSQTLGGAYSLARSTIDQMAVRIALQCSEADAHLILSADNSAARLLTRPGEAIYNDANGLVEGNSPFQVVWLPEQKRDDYLRQIRRRAEQIGWTALPAVFEGNAPAEVMRNTALRELLDAPTRPTPPVSGSRQGLSAWIGEAMSITGHTAVEFHRQNGSNMLIVGPQPEMAQGMFSAAIISLAGAIPPSQGESKPPATFWIIDSGQARAPDSGPLARLPALLPHSMRMSGTRDLPLLVGEVAAEVDRRQKDNELDGPSIFLVIHALQRARDLRRSEDDYGFGARSGEPLTPAQQLSNILKDGPAVGVHTLVWCDNVTNLQRAIDRQTMRELSLRVLFQMSVGDSSSLVDGPQAAKLGLYRALFYNEEDGRMEKLRPYAVPTEEWMEWVRHRFERRKVALNPAEQVG